MTLQVCYLMRLQIGEFFRKIYINVISQTTSNHYRFLPHCCPNWLSGESFLLFTAVMTPPLVFLSFSDVIMSGQLLRSFSFNFWNCRFCSRIPLVVDHPLRGWIHSTMCSKTFLVNWFSSFPTGCPPRPAECKSCAFPRCVRDLPRILVEIIVYHFLRRPICSFLWP